jgi:uncharacterized membrane protein
MDRRILAASVLTAAIGLAATGIAVPTSAQQQMTKEQMMKAQQDNMMRAKTQHLAACYGINAVARNDCAAGVHSCAGQATQARDPKSFVLLPTGDCEKIEGGSLKKPA